MELLLCQMNSMCINKTTVTEFGFHCIRSGNYYGVVQSIQNGGHMEDMLTEAIKFNRIDMVDLLLSHGATVFPSDIELASKISYEMYYLVTKHPGLEMNTMMTELSIH